MAPPGGFVYIVIYLVAGCKIISAASGFTSRIAPSVASPPFRRCLNVRGGDVSSTVHTSTSLQSSIITAVDTFYKTMPLASAFLTVCLDALLLICELYYNMFLFSIYLT